MINYNWPDQQFVIVIKFMTIDIFSLVTDLQVGVTCGHYSKENLHTLISYLV